MASRPPGGRRPAAPPPPPPVPEPKKVPANVIVLAVILMLLAFGCGYGALVVQADLAQPVAKGNVACSPFAIGSGDTINAIADRMQQQHIIRNALMFKLYLKIKGKTLSVQPGSYCLSPSMRLQDIVATLSTPPSAAYVQFTVIDGDRLTQYPGDILASAVLHDPGNADDGLKGAKALPNFSATDFLNITIKTGMFSGIENYWYVKPWTSPALTKLEGYLAPNTYQVAPTATATDIIKTMLNGLGEDLCPDQTSADQFIFDQQQCKANQAIITVPANVPGAGTKLGVFDALQKYYPPTSAFTSLQQALIIASLAQREARSPEHHFKVASVYYNRYKKPSAETAGLLNADPAEQYWLGAQPGQPNPWPTFVAVWGPGKLPGDEANNPYNLYLTHGLPPSAIAGPAQDALYAGIFPPDTGYYYFFFGCDNTNHYAATAAEQDANQAKYGC